MGEEKKTIQCPTVGRIVYFKTRGSADGVYPKKDFASIVTEVVDADNLVINLVTFGPGGIRFELNVKNGQEGGMWDWMPFQKDQQKRYENSVEVSEKQEIGSENSENSDKQEPNVEKEPINEDEGKEKQNEDNGEIEKSE